MVHNDTRCSAGCAVGPGSTEINVPINQDVVVKGDTYPVTICRHGSEAMVELVHFHLRDREVGASFHQRDIVAVGDNGAGPGGL